MRDDSRGDEPRPPEGEPPGPRDPYAEAPTHDPVFPSWRYAGLRWLAERIYGGSRS